jgi:hypothetical protein
VVSHRFVQELTDAKGTLTGLTTTVEKDAAATEKMTDFFVKY